MPTMEEAYPRPGAPLHPPGGMNRCAGCSAVDVSLLACDDIDGNGTADPSQRARWVVFVAMEAQVDVQFLTSLIIFSRKRTDFAQTA